MTGYGSRTERWIASQWPAIHARGMRRFVLLRGVALWGGLMFVAMAAMMAYRFGVGHPRYPLLIAVALPLCAIGGMAWALLTWHFNERIHRALQSRTQGIP